MAPFGVFATWWGPLLAWLVDDARRDGVRHAGPSRSAPTSKGPESFGLIFRLGLIPLFLFSGAFFPISNLGPVGEWVARCTPLWHGVNLTRMFCLDTVDWCTGRGQRRSSWSRCTVVGWWLAIRTLDRGGWPQ